MKGEKDGDGAGGRIGWGVVVAEGEIDEDMRAWARAVEVGVRGRSMSDEGLAGDLWWDGRAYAHKVESHETLLLVAYLAWLLEYFRDVCGLDVSL